MKMKLEDIYKIADSKEFYNKDELLKTVNQTSSSVEAPKFKEPIQKINAKNRITILFPIYNEEQFLDYSLDSFFSSYLYPNTSYQILFFLNSCTDNSLNKTKALLDKYKNTQKKKFPENKYSKLCDKGIEKIFIYAEDQNSYYILNTYTKGRVNALQVAIRLAQKNHSQILMSFDTDFILDPLAIYNLSKNAIRKIVKEKKTVVMTGAPIMVNNKEYTKIQNWLRNHFVWKDQKYNSLSGCCLVLEPNWLNENIENNIIEDYALGLKARNQNFEIIKVEDARMWGYRTDFKDDIKQLSRSIKGRYQLLDTHPELKKIILKDHFFIQKFPKRFTYISLSILKDPTNVLKWLWTFLFVEIAILKAKKDYKRNPNSIHWKPLDSGR
ncbi:MAG: glycosyltransferase family 2 protein [Candidatus Dojkabacteria bacterium]|jgi:cellulose synthase/poly-beta-1,6-N-acetylglucosamine synthase-like glycosyltransferase